MNLKSSKFWVITILFFGWFVSYLDRFLINMALPFIGQEYHVNEATLGIVLSVFFTGYALVQIPGGWLSDKFGSRKIMLICLVLFSIFTAVTGLVWSIPVLIAVRFLFGIFEGSFPTASYKALSEYFLKTERTRVQSVLLASNPLSLAIAPLIAVPLILWIEWRGMFVLISLLGFIAALLYWLNIHPPIQKSESEIKENQNKKVPLKILFADKNIWKFAAINFGINILIWGFLSWLPSYMLKVQKLDLLHVGILSSLPGFAGIAGMLMGGWLADKLFDNREKYLLIFSIFIAALCLFVMINTTSLPLAVACQIIMVFCTKLAFIALWSMPLKRIDSHIMGSASGIINLGSQLAGVVSPMVMGFLIVAFNGSYTGAFGFLICCSVISIIVSMTLSSDKHVVYTQELPVLK